MYILTMELVHFWKINARVSWRGTAQVYEKHDFQGYSGFLDNLTNASSARTQSKIKTCFKDEPAQLMY
jgi:hypothetical protein